MAAQNFAFEEEAYPTKITLAPWLKVLKYSFKYWYLLLLMLVGLLFVSFYDSSFTPLMNNAALTSIKNSSSVTSIWDLPLTINFTKTLGFTITFSQYFIVLIAALLIRSLMIFGVFFMTDYINAKIMLDLRRDSFEQVQKLSFSYFDKTSSGWLIARMQSDTSKISDMISWGIVRMIWMTFDLVVTLITMFFQDWKLSLVILSTLPLIIIISPLFEKMILRLSRVARAAYSKYVGWLSESINGTKTIKTLSIENTVYQESDAIIEDIRTKTYERQRKQSFFMPTIMMISALTTGIIIVVAEPLGLDLNDVASMGLIILFINFVMKIYDPITEGAELFADVMATQANVEKVLHLIEEIPAIQDSPEVIEKYGTLLAPNTRAYEPMEGTIEFKDVSFSYEEDTEVIHNLSLIIPKGQNIAIVGETGSGKSTTVNLLCRFYEPTSGEILIDGNEYRSKSVGWLRSNIGYVQQTPFIFGGTIAENIRYGKLDATDEEIIAVAKKVNLDEYVSTLPDGYQSVLHDNGADLSVGQKQLISLARALIRDPHIMILDEATSSIDTETEAIIQKAINEVLKERTSIVIAHRLSTIVDSDRILFMEDGVIKEDGSHSELMKKKGKYYRLYMNQFKDLHIDTQIDLFDKQVKDNI